jgi:hypothetical protein
MQLTPAMHVLSIGQWVTCNIDGLNKEKAYLIIGYTLDLRGRVTVRLLETAGNPVESIQDSYTAYSDDNDWIDTMTVYGDDNDILDSHS